MHNSLPIEKRLDPTLAFCIGLAVVMLSLTVSIAPAWDTFIQPWRVELFASIFLLAVISYSAYRYRDSLFSFEINGDELYFVVLPIAAFITWSAFSMIWAASWKSSLHHTLVWSEYLIFYLTVRRLLDHGRTYSRIATTFACGLAFFGALAALGYVTFLIFGAGTKLGIVYAKYGEQVNTLFPLLLVGVLRQRKRGFTAGVGILVLLWLIVFCSLSRINLFLFTFSSLSMTALIFAFRRFRVYRKKMAIIAIVVVLAPLPLHIFTLFAGNSVIPMVARVSDDAGISNSNGFRRLMMSISGEMIVAHPLIGIGADNFGIAANQYRAAYAERSDDPNLAQAESEIPERAHNEYLQIVAELGIVGGAILLWLLCGIGIMTVYGIRRQRGRSLYAFGAMLGIAMFLASSVVSSYSFRLVQNGFVFFFVLAVAAKLTLRPAAGDSRSAPSLIPGKLPIAALAAGSLACILMVGYSAVRVTSVMYTSRGNYAPTIDAARPLYERAMRLDNENPEARYFLGLRLIAERRYAESVPLLRESIRIGKAPSADYSYLASAQSLAGDIDGAERTMAEAAVLYPRSPFVLVRYAALLKANGKDSESQIPLQRARQIDARQANAWWVYITEGAQAASDRAFRQREDFVQVLDLRPSIAFDAVKFERGITFPSEGFKFSAIP